MKNIIKLSAVVLMIVSLSSCGVFKKDCGCPHFGAVKHVTKVKQA